jgi:hypothetical protein
VAPGHSLSSALKNKGKASKVPFQELMRVYGALMWSISKVISVPECPKVFIGSFWDQQLKHDLYRRLFERELQCLFDDLQVRLKPVLSPRG